MPKLSDLFEGAQARTVSWRGETVYSLFELPALTTGVTIRIRFDRQNRERPEGLRIRVRDGALRLADQDLDDIVLWAATVAGPVEGQIRSEQSGVNVRIWNCWRDPVGVMQAWIGNAGMLVEPTDSGVLLRCSDGYGGVTFDDLVATVEVLDP